MVRRRYMLPGLTLRVTDAVDDPSRFAFPPLSAFETFDAGPFGHEIILRAAPDGEAPMRGALVWSGRLIDGSVAEISRDGATLQFRIPGRVSVIEDPGSAVTLVDYVDAVERPLFGMAVMVLIDIALRGHGLLMVHAATLLLPDSNGVILLFAPSGFGKTTTSLLLTLGGYGHLGDDVAIIRRHGAAFRAWGLPRALKVHRKTAAMLPQIAPLLDPFDGEDEGRLTIAALASITPVPPIAEYPIRAAVLVGTRSEGSAKLIGVPKSEALSAILSDNVGMLDDGVPAHAQTLFTQLSQLIATTPAYRLDAGADPASVVPAFDAMLASA